MVTSRISAGASAGSPDRTQPDYAFDFCGGHLAIDFTNTIGSRGDKAKREEHLISIGDVLAWSEAAGILTKRRATELRSEASVNPDVARSAFRRAIEFREVLYRLLAAIAHHQLPAPGDLTAFNRYVSELYADAAVVAAPAGFALETARGEGFDAVLRPVVRAAVELLTSPALKKVGLCADDSCAWLFLDTTRSGTRRWCDMKSCGNRNKVRRFRRA